MLAPVGLAVGSSEAIELWVSVEDAWVDAAQSGRLHPLCAEKGEENEKVGEGGRVSRYN